MSWCPLVSLVQQPFSPASQQEVVAGPATLLCFTVAFHSPFPSHLITDAWSSSIGKCSLYPVCVFCGAVQRLVSQPTLCRGIEDLPCLLHVHPSLKWIIFWKSKTMRPDNHSTSLVFNTWVFFSNDNGSSLRGREVGWVLEHCCTLSLCYLGGADDPHRNPNINTEII